VEDVVLNELTKSIPSKKTRIVESNKTAVWYPVLSAKTKKMEIGFMEDGIWAIEAKSSLYIMSPQREFLRSVALLEQPLVEIREEIDEYLRSNGVSIRSDSFFPFVEITHAGFEAETQYWVTLAFAWYDELAYEKKLCLKGSLRHVVDTKRASQKLRHKAFRELRVLEREELSGSTV